MDNESKHERSRTRWTASLDKIFVDLVVEQIQLGNRPNNVFDKKTWGCIRDEFNRQTGLNFNNNQLRKHFDVLRIRYNCLKSAINQNNFAMEDSSTVGFDSWESLVQTRPESVEIKEGPIFEQLCIIFTDNVADGKYAQSSHYEDLENRFNVANTAGLASCNGSETLRSEAPSSSKYLEDNVAMNMKKLKGKHPPETHPSGFNGNKDELQDAMAEALSDMIEASQLKAATATTRDENNLTITNCNAALDDVLGINQTQYFTALDLFEDYNFREVFLSLGSNEKRLLWLQHKCSDNVSLV